MSIALLYPTMAHHPRFLRSLARPLCLFLACCALVACESGGPMDIFATEPDAPSESAASLYERQRYQLAYDAASREYARSRQPERDEAALIAGLSAFAVFGQTKDPGQLDRAQGWLSPLESHHDPEIAGRAQATLGLIASARDNHTLAATKLSSAARKLEGNESAQAAFHAGLAYQANGQSGPARRSYQVAMASATDPALREQIRARLNRAGYTIQLGAFSRKDNAQKLATDVSTRAESRGLGEVAIVTRQDPTGRTLHLVQVGEFQTERDARRAQLTLGRGGIVTLIEPR